MDIREYCQLLPKAELHIHLQGSVQAATLKKICAKRGRSISEADTGSFRDLETFLEVLNIITSVIQSADDFQLITYQMLQNCEASGARYVEFFFSPHAHMKFGAEYSEIIDGIIAGMKDAERDHKVVSRAIPAHNRELGPTKGLEFIDLVQSWRTEEVIGVGLDYNEAPHPPANYTGMYQKARSVGLKTTIHAGETGPSAYVRSALDDLGCMRIDHGYAVVDDASLMRRCRDEEVMFTVCPSTTVFTTKWRDLAAAEHAISRMNQANLTLAINTDDPTIFKTNLTNEYVLLAEKAGFTTEDLATCALNSLEFSWMDPSTKRDWVGSWRNEIDQLIAAYEASDRLSL